MGEINFYLHSRRGVNSKPWRESTEGPDKPGTNFPDSELLKKRGLRTFVIGVITLCSHASWLLRVWMSLWDNQRVIQSKFQTVCFVQDRQSGEGSGSSEARGRNGRIGRSANLTRTRRRRARNRRVQSYRRCVDRIRWWVVLIGVDVVTKATFCRNHWRSLR